MSEYQDISGSKGDNLPLSCADCQVIWNPVGLFRTIMGQLLLCKIAIRQSYSPPSESLVQTLGSVWRSTLSYNSFCIVNQQTVLTEIRVQQNGSHKKLPIGAISYMFRHQSAIFREFINNKGSLNPTCQSLSPP